MICLDDNLDEHPKFVGLSDDSFALWVRALMYCRKHKTDGYIPEDAARRRVRGKRRPATVIQELLDPPKGSPEAQPLWAKVPGGYQFHDYLDWNPSKDEVLAKFEAKRQAGRMGGRRSGAARRGRPPNQTGSKTEAPCFEFASRPPNQTGSKTEAPCFEFGSSKTNPVSVSVSGSGSGSDPDLLPPGGSSPPLPTAGPAPEGGGGPTKARFMAMALEALRGHPATKHAATEAVCDSIATEAALAALHEDDLRDALAYATRASAAAAAAGGGGELLVEVIVGHALTGIRNAKTIGRRRRAAQHAATGAQALEVASACPSSTDREAPAWLERHGVPALHSMQGADVARFLDHHASKGARLFDWAAAWRKWASSPLGHVEGPAPGHKPPRRRERVPPPPQEGGETLDPEATMAAAKEAMRKLGVRE